MSSEPSWNCPRMESCQRSTATGSCHRTIKMMMMIVKKNCKTVPALMKAVQTTRWVNIVCFVSCARISTIAFRTALSQMFSTTLRLDVFLAFVNHNQFKYYLCLLSYFWLAHWKECTFCQTLSTNWYGHDCSFFERYHHYKIPRGTPSVGALNTHGGKNL